MKKAVNFNIQNNFNKGYFLSAKIYSDVKNNLCDCGGQFTERDTFKGYEFPCCNKCKSSPSRFRVNARIVDIDGNNKTVSIRHNQVGERLTEILDVLVCLKVIKQEIENGDFDARRYSSKVSKSSFVFKNFSEKYIEHYESKFKKGEISPASLRKKKTLIRLHILPYFKNIDINKIKSLHISMFRDSFTDKLRTRDQATSELQTMLRYAHKYELVSSIPFFDKIPKSNKRKNIPSMEVIKSIIPFLPVRYKDIFTILTIYPIRPSELRCLRWNDIDLINNKLTIQRHLSDSKELKGRKSISIDSPKGKIVYPITIEIGQILISMNYPLDRNALVFPSPNNPDKFLSKSALPKQWRIACKKAGVEYFEPYEIKHARATEISKNNNGDVIKTMEATGHTNVNTVMRYIDTKTNLSEIFN